MIIFNEGAQVAAAVFFNKNFQQKRINRLFTSSYIHLYRGELLFKIIFSLFSAIKPVVIPKEKKAALFSAKKDDSLLKGHLVYNWVSLRRFNIVLTSLVNIRSWICFCRGLKRT